MEDAMVINKTSYERGLAHGMVYHSEFVDLKEPRDYFAVDPKTTDYEGYLEADGLPIPGIKIKKGDPYYS